MGLINCTKVHVPADNLRI